MGGGAIASCSLMATTLFAFMPPCWRRASYPEEELETYGLDDSRLPMSGMATYTPGMEISGGSLGQGLHWPLAWRWGWKRKQSAAWVVNSMSDGELDEGSTWEAAMSAAHYGLWNLIVPGGH